MVCIRLTPLYSILYMKWMHEQRWKGQIFHFRSIAQDDVCMWQRNCLGKQVAENASSSGGSVRRITVHMRQPRYLGTYLSERTAAAAWIAGATKDPLLPCGQVQLSGFFLFFRSALAKKSVGKDYCDLKGLLNPATTGLFRGILGLRDALAISPKLLFCIVGRASRSQKIVAKSF